MNAPLCRPCAGERERWLDYRLPPASLGYITQAVAGYDLTAAGIGDRRKARFAQWRNTVRFQQRLITSQCLAGIHAAAQPSPRPPVIVVQLELPIAAAEPQGVAA